MRIRKRNSRRRKDIEKTLAQDKESKGEEQMARIYDNGRSRRAWRERWEHS